MLNPQKQKYSDASPLPILAQAIQYYNGLILKLDNFKVDLQSSQGIQAFKAYTSKIQELIQLFSIPTKCRGFRNTYTKAYRILYNDCQLGYIPQIYDAAQEAYPYIWVNGECYLFEPITIQKGQKLVQIYFRLIQLIRLIYLHTNDKNKQISIIYQMQLKERLQEFDQAWIAYQKCYIEQLIKIEEQAKKNIIQTVAIQKNLSNYENQQKINGKIFYNNNPQYHSIRNSLCQKIGKLNSIANISGKGRDDLSYNILLAAQNVLTKISNSQSKSIRIVAQKIRQSFYRLREVLKSFQENIEMVDPQLKNNQSLVQALAQYELNWEKGKRYFLQQKKQSQILQFSTILQAAKQKYQYFKQQLQYSDPCVFWMIPSIVVLNSLEGQDQGLAQSFIQQMKSNEKLLQQYILLKSDYTAWKIKQNNHQKKRQLYNQLQKSLIMENQESGFKEIVSKIKQFAINLERVNPIDWNDMLSVLLTQEN